MINHVWVLVKILEAQTTDCQYFPRWWEFPCYNTESFDNGPYWVLYLKNAMLLAYKATFVDLKKKQKRERLVSQ